MKESREALRTRILEGAIVLFTEKGIERVTTRELTEHVGLSRSHIYHYFRDWETLCKEAMALFMQQDQDDFATLITGMQAEQRLAAFVANYLPTTPDASWPLYSSLWQLAIHDDEWAAMTQTMMAQWQTMLANIILEGIRNGEFTSRDPDRVTRQLGAMLNGYADQLIISPAFATHQAASRDIEDFILLALKAR